MRVIAQALEQTDQPATRGATGSVAGIGLWGCQLARGDPRRRQSSKPLVEHLRVAS